MRFMLQMAAAILAALAATLIIVTFELAGQPVMLAALLLACCCLGPLLGLLPAGPSALTAGRGDPARESGHVKWFNASKGFGFIRRENGEEIFVHFRSVKGSNRSRRLLKDEQRVSFKVVESNKGPQAEDVEILD